MQINVDCYYCNKFSQCTNPKRKKILGFIPRECVELNLGRRCSLAVRHRRPLKPTVTPR